jgi:hypothetical protein
MAFTRIANLRVSVPPASAGRTARDVCHQSSFVPTSHSPAGTFHV